MGSASVTPPTVLRTLAAVRNLTPAEAGHGYRVQVRGIVTYSDTDPLVMSAQDFFLLGAHAGLYVKGPAGPHFKAGDQVQVVGRSATGEFAPVIKASQVRRLGHTPLPPAPLTTGAALVSGSEDAQWIRLQGIVHQVIAAGSRTAVKLVVGNTLVHVLIAPSSRGLSASGGVGIGSLVTVFGVVKTLYNSQRQNLGFEVWVPSFAEFHLDQAGPPAPFALPLDDIAALVRFDPRGGSRRLWHVQGVVTLQSTARNELFVQSSSGGVYLPAPQAPTLRVGDLADVVGFPVTSAGKPILSLIHI